jgi:hypothetical protein
MDSSSRISVWLRALWYMAVLIAILLLHDFPESAFRYWRM